VPHKAEIGRDEIPDRFFVFHDKDMRHNFLPYEHIISPAATKIIMEL
jgi:hypothetical protein